MQVAKKAQQVPPDKRAAPEEAGLTRWEVEVDQIMGTIDLCERIIERHVDAVKASSSGRDLPREVCRQILQARTPHRVDLALRLLQEELDEPRKSAA